MTVETDRPVAAPPRTDFLAEATRALRGAGVPSPRHDAQALAAFVLGVSRSRLLLHAEALADHRPAYQALIARRAGREPLQHILGAAAFRHLDLLVGPGVLIPRPETELLVDEALRWLAAARLPRPRVVDLGTGTGALALAIASEWPAAQVWAVEREPAALVWAARNIAATRLPAALVAGDMVAALPELSGRVDLVISNPPYLPLELEDSLDPEVRDHDPRPALFAGPDALDGVRAVQAAARRLLRPEGYAIVEHGADQGETGPACFGAGWHDVRDHSDLAGRSRYLTVVRA